MNILFAIKDLETEHLGIMYLSSILKKAGHKVDIVEARYDKIKKKLKNDNFTTLAYSVPSKFARYYLNLNQRIKEEFKIFSVFGGPHFTYFPEAIKEPGVDGVCIGEGEYALLDLVNNLDAGKPITHIENWWIKVDGDVFRNSPRSLINNLDELPFPDRKLFSSKYPAAYITTSRGCPYCCSFCAMRSEFRRRSVDNVIEELRMAKVNNYAKFVYFADSTFNISLSWIRGFSEKYRKEIDLPFFCSVRADLVTPECIKYLKEAGCTLVGMGVETANDSLRNEVFKKGISKEQIISAVEIIKKYKIRLKTYNIIGIPFGSLKDDLDTLRLNIQCRPSCAEVYPLAIYKNTDIYNSLIQDRRFKRLELFPKYIYLPSDFYNSVPDIRKIKNLYKLFGLIITFPSLFPLVPFLIRLPLYHLYSFLNFIWIKTVYFLLYGRYLMAWRKLVIQQKLSTLISYTKWLSKIIRRKNIF